MSSFQDQLAAATIAKIFGSELKKVDENTIAQSSTGPATKIDPMSFITAIQDQRRSEQQRMIEESNRLAEQLHPLPPDQFTPSATPPPIPQPAAVQQQPVITKDVYALTKEDVQSIRSQLERINSTLTKMSGMLGKVFENFNRKNGN